MFIKNQVMNILQYVVGLYGYEIVKKSFFDKELKKLLQKNDFFFIQVGAHDGVRFDCLYTTITPYDISGIVIEPIKKYYRRLAINYEEYKKVVPLSIALHPTAETADLYYVDIEQLHDLPKWSAGIGSFYKKHHDKTNIPDECVIKENVQCQHLMDIIEKYNVKSIDLLQIDTEGFDFEILKMLNFKKIKPQLIKYEFVNLDKNTQQKSIQFLENAGYKVCIESSDAVAILNK